MRVELWENENGKSPVAEFIESLPVKPRKKVVLRIELLEEKGFLLLNTPYLKKLSLNEDLYELRIVFNGMIYRIFLVFMGGVAWLLHAFQKKSQKTPQKEIRLALARKRNI